MSDKAWGIILNKLREMTSGLFGRVSGLPKKEATPQIKTKTLPEIGVPSESVIDWDRKTTPWRQGHLVGDTDAKSLKLRHPDFPKKTVVLVISHDCDVAQDTDKEPTIEVIVGYVVDQPDKSMSNAKNARLLELDFVGDNPFRARFSFQNRLSIPKSRFQGLLPSVSSSLEKPDIQTLQRWLAFRYRRPAFPDAFDARIKDEKIADNLAKLSKVNGDSIIMLLFDLEAEKDGVFPLGILAVYKSKPDPGIALDHAKKLCEKINNLFETKLYDEAADVWRLIELRYCDPISDEDLTYAQYDGLPRWNLDYVSLAADPQQPHPTD
jgi:hypothetical protein